MIKEKPKATTTTTSMTLTASISPTTIPTMTTTMTMATTTYVRIGLFSASIYVQCCISCRSLLSAAVSVHLHLWLRVTHWMSSIVAVWMSDVLMLERRGRCSSSLYSADALFYNCCCWCWCSLLLSLLPAAPAAAWCCHRPLLLPFAFIAASSAPWCCWLWFLPFFNRWRVYASTSPLSAMLCW